MSSYFSDGVALPVEWLIVGVRHIPSSPQGKVCVIATRSTFDGSVTAIARAGWYDQDLITGGGHEYRFEARSSDMVLVYADTYADALRKLGGLWDADNTASPAKLRELPPSAFALEDGRA